MAFLFIGYVYNAFVTTPQYKSATTLILVKAENSGTTTNDVTLNQKLVYTYSELVKSDSVLNEVISRVQLDKTTAQLRKNVTIESVKNTEIIKISVQDSNKDEAQLLQIALQRYFLNKLKKFIIWKIFVL